MDDLGTHDANDLGTEKDEHDPGTFSFSGYCRVRRRGGKNETVGNLRDIVTFLLLFLVGDLVL